MRHEETASVEFKVNGTSTLVVVPVVPERESLQPATAGFGVLLYV